jgi:hypothetical protein
MLRAEAYFLLKRRQSWRRKGDIPRHIGHTREDPSDYGAIRLNLSRDSRKGQDFSTFFLCSKISSMMPYSLACCAPM